MTVEKPIPNELIRPMTTGACSMMNQSEFQEINCNLLKARHKSRVQGAIGFGFATRWLRNWSEIYKPIPEHSNHNRVITFGSHLKSSLFTTYTNPIIHLFNPPKICIGIVFDFP